MKGGEIRDITCSEITQRLGTIQIGGGAITRASFLCWAHGITGTRATGCRHGGHHSDAVYAYDGPIYAFNDLAPDQVVANVQATLQELGYYHGPINGYLDSAIRAAIANYQREHGLYATSAIDEATLVALGMA